MGHIPHAIDFTGWKMHRSYGHCFLVCVCCRSILKLTHRSRKHCLEKPCNRFSPGIGFWSEAQKRGKLDEMAVIFKMKNAEVAKVCEALAAKVPPSH